MKVNLNRHADDAILHKRFFVCIDPSKSFEVKGMDVELTIINKPFNNYKLRQYGCIFEI